MASDPIHILAFYLFHPLSDTQQGKLKTRIEALGESTGLRGLILLGAEGINLTASGDAIAIAGLECVIDRSLNPPAGRYKRSRAARHPFRVLKVKTRAEIVTIGRSDRLPDGARHHHLSPAEWHAAMTEPNVVVLDTRNGYEVDLGKFKGAQDFGTREFREFPEKLKDCAIPKDKKILIYCTGGIRCEKAILEMEAQGYGNVHQLDGGILNYLKEYPEQDFEGECFVFDYRVAVDQRLKPTTRFGLCPHCGQPASRDISCAQCAGPAVVCVNCETDQPTCSKNCAHHRSIGSRSRRPHAQERAKRRRALIDDQSADSSSAPVGG